MTGILTDNKSGIKLSMIGEMFWIYKKGIPCISIKLIPNCQNRMTSFFSLFSHYYSKFLFFASNRMFSNFDDIVSIVLKIETIRLWKPGISLFEKRDKFCKFPGDEWISWTQITNNEVLANRFVRNCFSEKSHNTVRYHRKLCLAKRGNVLKRKVDRERWTWYLIDATMSLKWVLGRRRRFLFFEGGMSNEW